MSKVPINANIIGGRSNEAAADVIGINTTHGHRAANWLVVRSHPFLELQSTRVQFTNPEYGSAMNQDGAFSGTPLGIQDGDDTALWTAQNVVGTKLTAGSTDRFYGGAASVLVDNPSLNDTWEFDKASNQDLSGYVALTMRVNVDKDWDTEAIEIYGWDGTAEVGGRVQLAGYLPETVFDVWHPVVIPLSDMGLTGQTIQSFRMQLTSAGAAKKPKFYMDAVQLEETGADLRFTAISPVFDRRFHVYSMVINVADALDMSVVNGTVAGLSYDKLLGATLTNGLSFQVYQDGLSYRDATIGNAGDMLDDGFATSFVQISPRWW